MRAVVIYPLLAAELKIRDEPILSDVSSPVLERVSTRSLFGMAKRRWWFPELFFENLPAPQYSPGVPAPKIRGMGL
jgi:hypothetical protein